MSNIFCYIMVVSEQNIQSAPSEFSTSIVRNFEKYRSGLLSTVNAALKNRHYQNMNLQVPLNFNYDTFSQFPILTSDQFSPPEDFICGNPDEMYMEQSGGTTGKNKEIYYTEEMFYSSIDPEIIKQLKEAQNPILLHKGVNTISYKIIELSLHRYLHAIQIKTYLPVKETIDQIQDHDVVYITEQVSKMRELMSYLERTSDTLEKVEMLKQQLKDKQFFLELVAEPIDKNEIVKWYELIYKLTGKTPRIWGLYGTSETLGLGFWEFDPNNSTAEVEYKILNNKFVEVLDSDTGRPVESGQIGKIVVTPIYPENYQGTTVIRYDTGDYGMVRYTKEGDMYISQIQRDPNAGQISILGEKIYANQIWKVLQEKIGFPISMRFSHKTIISSEHPDRETIVLSVGIFSENIDDPDKVKKEFIKTMSNLCPTYDEFIDAHKLVLDITTGTEPPKDQIKAWKIVKP